MQGIAAFKKIAKEERAKGCRLRKDTKRVCARAKKEEATQERKKGRESSQEEAA